MFTTRGIGRLRKRILRSKTPGAAEKTSISKKKRKEERRKEGRKKVL